MATSVLKMSIHCKGCGRKVKRLLKKIHGVSSVAVDADQGRLTIVSTVDPHTLIAALDKAGLKAELIQETSVSMKNNSLQIVAHTKPSQSVDQRMIANLHQLSKIEDLENVEVTYSKSVRLSFQGQKDDPPNIKDNKIVYGYVNGPQMGPGGACCGGQVGHGTSCCGGQFRVCGMHNPYANYWAPPPCGCIPPPQPPLPPLWQRDIPSAPPVAEQASNYYSTAPPQPVAYSYPVVFRDEKPTTCKLM
ncbi:hypothetical protein LguiA_023677 [Lonicera macranthoides]